MIAVDTSALIAIYLREPEAATFRHVLSENASWIATPTLCEAWWVIAQKTGDAARADRFLNALLSNQTLRPRDFDMSLQAVAIDALRRYGRGRHPAQLNFGDCFSYALARGLNIPLLYKGADFARTDVTSHRASVAI